MYGMKRFAFVFAGLVCITALTAPHAGFAGLDRAGALDQNTLQTYAGDGVLVRVNGNIRLDPGEREAVVVVVEGDAEIFGEVEVVVVVDGTATLSGARVRELIVVGGTARLFDNSVVDGDVQLVGSELVRSGDAVVRGEVLSDAGERFGRGLLIFGLVFGLGSVVALLLSGLAAAAVAPHAMRSAGAVLTDNFGKTVLGTLVVWIGFPIVAGIGFITVLGIPTALGIMFVLLPAMGFLGYIVSGIRLGDYVLASLRNTDEAWHPYLAVLTGMGILLVAGLVPVLGTFVTPLAGLLGAGALAVHAWRSMHRAPRGEYPTIPEAVLTDIQGK